MADGSDEPHVVDPMVALARDGADVVSASRYMRGGRQVGGPPLKRLMSRTAGLTLHWFAGVPTHDPTNNFKLYSRRFLDTVTIESTRRLRARARAHGQGHDRRPPRRRGPDDVARPDRGREQLQAPQVAAALPALVLGRRSAARLGSDRAAAASASAARASASGFGCSASSQSGGFWARRVASRAPADTGGIDARRQRVGHRRSVASR